jgi:hypothetical protein
MHKLNTLLAKFSQRTSGRIRNLVMLISRS